MHCSFRGHGADGQGAHADGGRGLAAQVETKAAVHVLQHGTLKSRVNTLVAAARRSGTLRVVNGCQLLVDGPRVARKCIAGQVACKLVRV